MFFFIINDCTDGVMVELMTESLDNLKNQILAGKSFTIENNVEVCKSLYVFTKQLFFLNLFINSLSY